MIIYVCFRVSLLIAVLILAGLSPGADVLARQPGSFPLAGTWSGTAHNGDFIMDITIVVEPSCQIGELCGTFSIPTLPCAGTFTLIGEANGLYEFQAGGQQGNCGAGRDFLERLPDDTLRYTSRGDFGETIGILTQQGISPLPVLYDDDGSPDGTTALFYLLSDPAASVQAITISYGEAHPPIYVQHVGRLLDSFGLSTIPLGAGEDASPANHDFPEWLRQSANSYWDVPLPNADKTYPVQNAAQLIVSTLNAAPDPITIFVSGPCTNLAQALRLDPGIKTHIAAVYIMGGAVYVPGNLSDFYPELGNIVAEWNIYEDPQSADEIFRSGLPLYLIPLDATNQISITRDDTAQWRTGGTIADAAADMYDMLLSISGSMAIWDVMTAEIMIHPELCDFQHLHLEVVTDEDNTSGQTIALTEGTPNVNVCLEPDTEGITRLLAEVFSAAE